VVENSLDAIILHQQGVIKFANRATAKLAGYTSEELLGKNILAFVAPEYHNFVLQHMTDRLAGKVTQPIYELELIRKDQSRLPVEISATVVEFDGERLSLAFIRDISERKHAEAEIKKRQTYLEMLLKSNPSAIATLDKKNRVIDWNSAAEKIFGYSWQEVLGKNIDDIITNPEVKAEAQNLSKHVLSGESIFNREIVRYRKDGTAVDLILSGAPLTIDDKIEGTMAVYTDISALKNAEKTLRSLLKEKTALVSEIHHRVKNNLQVMVSLLNLQATRTDDLRTAHILEESKRRMLSMAIVHEQMYATQDFANINFKQYIETVIKEMMFSREIREKISFKKDLSDVLLDIDTAIPCGLLLNELLSNALRHAFPGNRKGQINLSLRPQTEKLFELVVSDNGIGFPEHIDFQKSESFGLVLLKLLVKQVRGRIELIREKGTTFKIEIPLK